MGTIVTDAAIKQAFSHVKKDITELKRAINKNVFALEKISGKADNATTKDEFYKFVDALSAKLDHFENSYVTRQGADEFAKQASQQIDSLRRQLEAREKLADDIKEIRRVRANLVSLEKSAVRSTDLHKELSLIDRSLSDLRRQLGSEATLQKYDGDLKALRQNVELLKKDAVTWKQYRDVEKKQDSAVTDARSELAAVQENISKLSAEAARIQPIQEQVAALEDASRKLEQDSRKLSSSMLSKQELEKGMRELRGRVDELAATIERSLVEADLKEFVSHKDLRTEIKALDARFVESKKVESVEQELKDVKSHIKDLAKPAAKNGNGLDDMRKDIVALQKMAEKSPADELRVEMDSLQRQVASVDELDELRDDIASLRTTFDKVRAETKDAKPEKRDDTEVKAVRSDLKYVMDNMVSVQDLREQALSSEQSVDTLRHELKELRKQVKELEKAKPAPKNGKNGGGLSKISSAIAGFFTEEEEPKKTEPKKEQKKAEPKKETMKEQKKDTPKKENGEHTTLYTIGGILILVALLGGIYFLSSGTPEEPLTEDLEEPVGVEEPATETPVEPAEETPAEEPPEPSTETPVADEPLTEDLDEPVGVEDPATRDTGASEEAEPSTAEEPTPIEPPAEEEPAAEETPADEGTETTASGETTEPTATPITEPDGEAVPAEPAATEADDDGTGADEAAQDAVLSDEAAPESFLSRYWLALLAVAIIALGIFTLSRRGKPAGEELYPKGNGEDVVDLKEFFEEKKKKKKR